jgi:hypothetical protein
MRRAGVKLAALAAVVVFVFAGCAGDDDDDDAGGGGGGGSESTERNVSEADYQAAANEICQGSTDALAAAGEKVQAELGDNPTPEAAAQSVIDDGIPILRQEIEDLRALDLPSENAQAYEQLLNDYEDAVDELEQSLEDDPEAFLTAPDPFADVNARAVELGLTGLSECGSTDSTEPTEPTTSTDE